MVVFPPISVVDTKIIYGYNFVAPLRTWFSLSVSVYFYWYLHTYKILLPVKTINFLFFQWYYWNYKIALPVTAILFLFNWCTGKTKTTIFYFNYIMHLQGSFLSLAFILMNFLYPRSSICM